MFPHPRICGASASVGSPYFASAGGAGTGSKTISGDGAGLVGCAVTLVASVAHSILHRVAVRVGLCHRPQQHRDRFEVARWRRFSHVQQNLTIPFLHPSRSSQSARVGNQQQLQANRSVPSASTVRFDLSRAPQPPLQMILIPSGNAPRRFDAKYRQAQIV